MRRTVQCFVAYFALAIFVTHPGNVLAQDGTRTITVRDLATLRDINGLNISPDGRWAAFSIAQAAPDHNRYDIAWYVIDTRGGNARRLADGGEMLPSIFGGRTTEYLSPRISAWSPDSRWLAYLRRDNGRTQVWRTPRDGGKAQQVTHNDADVRALAYAKDGNRILFQTELSQRQIAQGLAAEGRTGFLYDERFFPFYSPLPIGPRDVDPQRPNTPTASQIEARQVWAVEVRTGRERLATDAELAEFVALTAPPQPVQGASSVAMSRGGAVGWAEARDPERRGMSPPRTIVAQPSGSSNSIVCSAPACTNGYMSGLWWRNNDELLFVRREGVGRQDRALYSWRLNDVPRLVMRAPHLFGDYPGCSVARDKLLCLYEQPDYPRRLVAVDLDSGAVETLYDPNPDFARFELGPPPQRLALHAKSGAETYGYLVLPPHRRGHERVPLVIVTYTCNGFLRGGVGDEYPIYPFAAQGFAVLCFSAPDDLDRMARLDAASYTNWERGPGIPMRQRINETLDAAVAQLDQMELIDPDRVGITGLSYGAEIVFSALPHMPRLAAAIASSGGPGAGQYPYQGRTTQRWYRTFGLGAPNETPERWREHSFTSYVGQGRAPLLINVADREFVGSLDTVTALEDADRAVEMYVFPDEYHVKWQPAHRLAIYNRNVDWMNFWLRNVDSRMTGDASQYARWLAMRDKVRALRNSHTIAEDNEPREATARR